MRFVLSRHTLPLSGITRPYRACVVADFHNGEEHAVVEAIRRESPDLILIPGDFVHKRGKTEHGFVMLSACAAICPTYCSLGNHETRCRLPDVLARVEHTGAVLLDDAAVRHGELTLGGLSTGYRAGVRQGRLKPTPPPNLHFLSEFEKEPGCRILLCHHPEYYEPYIRERNIPLTVSGHAHGGQWELFGRGLFAPGQGFFPRYTAGLYEGRLLVSRGLAGVLPLLPRIGNPRELLVLNLVPTI